MTGPSVADGSGPIARSHASADLLASFWTLAGQVGLGSDMPSPRPLHDRIRAAGAAGYAGVGFDHRDVAAASANGGLEGIRRVLTECGIRIVELELLTGWYPDPGAVHDSIRAAGHRRAREDLLHAAAVLGARHIKVGAGFVDTGLDTSALADAFAQVCADAAGVGTQVMLELLPVGPVSSLERIVDVVTRSGASNGGILLDAWHVHRARLSVAGIANLPAGMLRYVELCDGMRTGTGSFIEDTSRRRLLCGDGEFDLVGFIEATRRAGYNGPWGVEILSDTIRAMPLDVTAARTVETTRDLLARSPEFDRPDGAQGCGYSNSKTPNRIDG